MTDEEFVNRIATLLYEGILESCEGYVEDFSQYPNDDGIPSSEVVDGRVDFPVFARFVIDKLNLRTPSGLDEFHESTTHNPQES